VTLEHEAAGLEPPPDPSKAAPADPGLPVGLIKRWVGKISGTGERAVWTILDQAVSSATNAAVALLVARAVDVTAFGAFALAFAVYALVVGFSRSCASSPLGIRYSGRSLRQIRRPASAATGTALTVGLAASCVLALCGVVISGVVGASLLALAVVLPGLLVQDAWRYVFFACGRPAAAVVNDAVWALAQVVAVDWLVLTGVSSAALMLLAWGGAGGVAALFGVVQARAVPDPRQALSWLRKHRDLWGFMTVEYVIVQASQQVAILLIAVLGGVAAVGAVRGVQVLLGPATIFAIGLYTFAVPEFSRRQWDSGGRDPARGRQRAVLALSLVTAAGGATWGLFLLALPGRIGVELLGDTWALSSTLLLAAVVGQAGAAASVGTASMLYAMGRARETLRVHVVFSVLLLIFSTTGVVMAGALGATWGQTIAFWAVVPMWFLVLRSVLRPS